MSASDSLTCLPKPRKTCEEACPSFNGDLNVVGRLKCFESVEDERSRFEDICESGERFVRDITETEVEVFQTCEPSESLEEADPALHRHAGVPHEAQRADTRV